MAATGPTTRTTGFTEAELASIADSFKHELYKYRTDVDGQMYAGVLLGILDKLRGDGKVTDAQIAYASQQFDTLAGVIATAIGR